MFSFRKKKQLTKDSGNKDYSVCGLQGMCWSHHRVYLRLLQATYACSALMFRVTCGTRRSSEIKDNLVIPMPTQNALDGGVAQWAGT